MNRKLGLLLVCAGLIVPVTACSNGSNTSSSSSTTTESSAAAGGAASAAPGAGQGSSITIAGSTALLPLVKQASQDYQSKNSQAKVSVSGGGSRVGITQAAQKGVDIGDSDIPAPDQPALVDHQVAVVQFDVVVNPASGVKKLTSAQVQQIFSGKTTNFKDVGGKDQAITIINRPRSSGTRAVFVQKFMSGQQPIEGGATQDSSGTVASIVGQTPGAISYLAHSYVKGGQIVALSIDGVDATPDNVKSGKYKFWSYEHMFTDGPPRPEVNAFINFVKTDTSAIDALGFIPVGDMKAK